MAFDLGDGFGDEHPAAEVVEAADAEGADPTGDPVASATEGGVTRRSRLGVVITLGLLLGAGAIAAGRYAANHGRDATPPGTGPVPAFELDNLRGGEPSVRLADHLGRPIVLNFWASWCPPCLRELPAYQQVYREVGGRVVFLGVNHQDARDAALAVLADAGVSYPSGYDPEGRTALEYGLIGLPTTVFVSPDGQILERSTGELTADELRGAIQRLFGG